MSIEGMHVMSHKAEFTPTEFVKTPAKINKKLNLSSTEKYGVANGSKHGYIPKLGFGDPI